MTAIQSTARRAAVGMLALACSSSGPGATDAGDASLGSRDAAHVEASPSDALDTGLRPADATPRDTPRDAASDTESARPAIRIPLTGCSQGLYMAQIEVGAGQTFQLALDTGSTTLGVAAAGCESCGVSPLYSPGPHSTDEHESASSSFGDGTAAGATGWSGTVYEDVVGVGGTAAASMRFVAIESQSGFFFQQHCGGALVPFQGVVGFAPVLSAVPDTDGYLDKLIAAYSLPNVFATELCDPGGFVWLGGYDPAYATALPQYTPYSTSGNQYYSYVVDMERIVVDGTSVDVPTAAYGDTLLDTGNNNFNLPPNAFTTAARIITESAGFRAAFGADGGPDAGGSFFSTTGSCATTTLTKQQLDATLPPITFVFGSGPAISVHAVATEAYLSPSGTGTWCPAMFPIVADSGYPFIASLGSPALRSNLVIFDREHSRIGFAPHRACP